MKPVKNNDTINMHNDDLPPLPRKTAWSIIRDAMVQAARIERGGYSNEERSARFDAVAAQAEKAIQALPAVAASGSPPSPPRAWRESPAVMEKFRAIRLDDTMSDELDLAELLDCATALVAVGAAPLAQPTPPPAVTREGRSAQPHD